MIRAPSFDPCRPCRRRRAPRRGLAALVLVLALALLVGTFAIVIGKTAANSRKHERDQQMIALLESAIHTAQTLGDELASGLRLPVDDDANVWIDVKLIDSDDQSKQIEATLVRNDRPGMSIRRQLRGNS
ncbi:hypothetical protein [Rhodopirellula baltica]